MFEKITPEQAGISSKAIADYISVLERRGFATHSLLMMKGDKIFAEYYWAPFNKDFCHRMYSQTKSYVAIAIGLLEEDGLIDLDRPMVSYFPEKVDGELHPFRAQQTVREMLTMQTPAGCPNWFEDTDPDRTHLYINKPSTGIIRPCNTTWSYDSAGSQVMASLVEKISGKSLFDFLYERIFKHHTVRQEEGQALTFVHNRKQFKLFTHFRMVAFFCFFKHGKVSVHFVLFRKRRTVDTGEHFVMLVATPVRARDTR